MKTVPYSAVITEDELIVVLWCQMVSDIDLGQHWLK